MVITGSGGSITAGSRTVARIGAWSLRRTSAEPTFLAECQVDVVDTFWWGRDLTRTVAVDIGARQWHWDVRVLPPAAAIVRIEVSGSPRIV